MGEILIIVALLASSIAIIIHLINARRSVNLCIEAATSRLASLEQVLADTRALELFLRKISRKGRVRVEFDNTSGTFRIILPASTSTKGLEETIDITSLIEASTNTLIVRYCKNSDMCFIASSRASCETVEHLCKGFKTIIVKLGIGSTVLEKCKDKNIVIDVSKILTLAGKEAVIRAKISTLPEDEYCAVLTSIPSTFKPNGIFRLCRKLPVSKCILITDDEAQWSKYGLHPCK